MNSNLLKFQIENRIMTSKQIRQQFLDFFQSKGHKIVPSAPIVVKDDPTLMFTNAGMNQFKDYFLGNKAIVNKRIANSQKCLRVSGKHNDLEEVGVDTYHHTMFEMLGNWSFGDYFKEEAISWAWELLTEVFQLPKDRLYVSIFEGDEEDGVPMDTDAQNFWKKYIAEDRILPYDKKDNFWEMGDTGPCGPCSEIHVDLRPDSERAKIDGKTLVNADDPLVVEIWNLVFIQYNRMGDGSLVPLPDKHVDTGMGFERLCMALQAKESNYDTDVFTPVIAEIERLTGVTYNHASNKGIAFRVIADHIRAITFAIHDGQLPSNTGAGYVIRRILRRAVRYAFSYLDTKTPLLYQLLPVMIEQFGELYPELEKSKTFLEKVIREEENSFLRTLESGLRRFNQIEEKMKAANTTTIDGEAAFELYDTYGFPIDLTRLIASENGLEIDEPGFTTAMDAQKDRARQATKIDTGDWVILKDTKDVEFVGYDDLEADAWVVKYRKVTQKKKSFFQIVLDTTPFYAESGGQVGDTGFLQFGDEKITVFDTKKDINQFIHYVKKLPTDPTMLCKAVVNAEKRQLTASNHTATHLLHAAMRDVLGTHVEQKGSLVAPTHLRFDFSHFSKVEADELYKIEQQINEHIRKNIALEVLTDVPIQEAKDLGAMALFGEKYGDKVRVIIFDRDYSVELCGGTHVQATGEIGFCKITGETSVAAGVRRIEAITNQAAFEAIHADMNALKAINQLYKSPKNLLNSVVGTMDENTELRKEIERMQMEQAGVIKNSIKDSGEDINGIHFIAQKVTVKNADMVKKIAYDLRKEIPNLFLVLGAEIGNKAHLTLIFADELLENHSLNAGKMIRDLARNIKGGGGGQPFYATAGGKDASGLDKAFAQAREIVEGIA